MKSHCWERYLILYFGVINNFYIGADGQIMANKDCDELFAEYYSLKRIEFNDCFNTEITENMQKMFADCGELEEIDIDNLNTENVTDISNMFDGCQQIVKIDVAGFHTGKVKDMSHMFYDCESITDLNLENFDTKNVSNMSHMFYSCQSITDLNLENFDTGKVKYMDSMFQILFLRKLLIMVKKDMSIKGIL